MKLRKMNKQNGDGIAVVVYGITLMLVFTFLAINIANGKIIENGYNALRDSVFAASSGSVIHLMTSVDSYNEQEKDQTNVRGGESKSESRLNYDLYLQLALGYIINRTPVEPSASSSEDDVVVQSGNVNNFIKLDHTRVVNSTLALLEDSSMRGKKNGTILPLTGEQALEHFKVLMIFIEPHYDNSSYKKGFDIIVYGNELGAEQGTVYPLQARIEGSTDMAAVYRIINDQIDDIVNSSTPVYGGSSNYGIDYSFHVNLNDGSSSKEEMIRKMETKPYYMVVVKDFALPTLFQQTYTHAAGHDDESGNIFKDAFGALSGDGRLKTPIIALNSGKVERKLKDN